MLITIISSISVKPRWPWTRFPRWLQLAEFRAVLGIPATELSRDLLEVHAIYQSLYFDPSSPVPCPLVSTSNTLCPPQESESGSSCIDRMPHSVVFVIGSTGIFRRKRIFFPCTSTPFTSVSISGG